MRQANYFPPCLSVISLARWLAMCSGARAMHFISYQLKRAHLGCLRIGRDMFKEVGVDDPDVDAEALPIMTPARFDLLRVIHQWQGARDQFDIRQDLGLSPSTVSKMITRLVALKMLTRHRYPSDGGDDGRRSLVSMTALGRRLFHHALQVVFGGRRLIRSFEDFARQRGASKPWKIRHKVIALWDTVCDVSFHLGNMSWGEFPHDEYGGQWHKTKTQKKKPQFKYKNGILPDDVFRERFPELAAKEDALRRFILRPSSFD